MNTNTEKKASLFETLASVYRYGEDGPIPVPLRPKVRMYCNFAIVIIAIGIWVTIMSDGTTSPVAIILVSIGIALCVALYGLYPVLSIYFLGYRAVDGECYDHEFSEAKPPITRRYVTEMFIRLDDTGEEIGIRTNRKSKIIPVGEGIRIYVPQNATILERGEGKHFTSIFGYEWIA